VAGVREERERGGGGPSRCVDEFWQDAVKLSPVLQLMTFCGPEGVGKKKKKKEPKGGKGQRRMESRAPPKNAPRIEHKKSYLSG